MSRVQECIVHLKEDAGENPVQMDRYFAKKRQVGNANRGRLQANYKSLKYLIDKLVSRKLLQKSRHKQRSNK
jgi:hypothetical protein